MKKLLLLISLSFPWCGGFAFAQENGEGSSMPIPTFTNGGNTSRPIHVDPNTNWVLISSAPDLATKTGSTTSLGITTWRERFIVNYSSTAALFLYHNGTEYSTAISSWGVVLSSVGAPVSNGVGIGNSIKITHQDAIWGKWITSPNSVGGVGGYESYYSQNNRR